MSSGTDRRFKRSGLGVRARVLAALLAGVLLNLALGSRWFTRDLLHAPGSKLPCVSYDPRYRIQRLDPDHPLEGVQIPAQWIAEDLAKIAPLSHCVRTYFAGHGMQKLPELAEGHHLSVILGVHVSKSPTENRVELEAGVSAATQHSNIRSLLIGNEVELHNSLGDQPEISSAAHRELIREARRRVKVPVSTADVYQTWMAQPELSREVDFIALNDLPFWGGKGIEQGLESLRVHYGDLRWRYPQHWILLSEVGWPSAGPNFGTSRPSSADEGRMIRELEVWEEREFLQYSFFEAFDQPWKVQSREGRVGAQWGLFDASGNLKSNLSRVKPVWALVSGGLGLLLCLLVMIVSPWIRWRTALFSSLSLNALALMVIGLLFEGNRQYLAAGLGFWLIIAGPGFIFVVFILTQLRDLVEAFDRTPQEMAARESVHEEEGGSVDRVELPKVSIHVACHREPPEQVIATVQSLLLLDYPDFEILVIDNNSAEPSLYLPIQKFCEGYPERVRFFHEDFLAGFKAGALNYGLSKTDSKAEVIAVVDSDYVVDSSWLRDLIPRFSRPEVAVVQAPQAYRGWENLPFSAAMRDEYEVFFRVGMIQRGRRNAIIQHGTMLLIRRRVLEQVGGWSGESITEDTELGLRILCAGHKADYVPQVYGRGLTPQTSEAYFRQRFRWVHGATDILLKYWREFLLPTSRLSRSQRYHFLAGWLPWLLDFLFPIFVLVGVVGASYWAFRPLAIPPREFFYPFFGYFIFRFFHSLLLSVAFVDRHLGRAFRATVAGVALTWFISVGVASRLLRDRVDFHRTRKSAGSARVSGKSWVWAIIQLRLDAVLSWVLVAYALLFVVRARAGDRDSLAAAFALFLLAVPFLGRLLLDRWSREFNSRSQRAMTSA